MEITFELGYALDTFYFLICGALVMWMAAGFTMLEAGLVRAKNTTEILTKNVALYAISCIMFMVCGYWVMYGGADGLHAATPFLDGILGDGVAEHEDTYSPSADFFFQVVFVATVHECSCGLMRFVCRCCQGFGKLILRQPLEECLFAKGIDGQLSLSSERKGR